MEFPSKLLNKDIAKAKLFQVSIFFQKLIPSMSNFEIEQTKPIIVLSVLKVDLTNVFLISKFFLLVKFALKWRNRFMVYSK